MDRLRTAAQQALEALEAGAESWRLIGPAIAALRAALEQPNECRSDFRQAAQQALEVLRDYRKSDDDRLSIAMSILGTAIAEAEKQEPVLVVEQEPDYISRGHFYEGSKPFIALEQPEQEPLFVVEGGKLRPLRPALLNEGDNLYTHPPRREWRGLTEEEIIHGREQLLTEDLCGWSFRQGLYFAEAKLKELNHG